MNDKKLFIVLGTSILIFVSLFFCGWYLMEGLQSIFNMTGRFAYLAIGVPEYIVLGFFPLINYILLKQNLNFSLKKLLLQNTASLIIITGFIGLGILTMCLFKFDDMASPLLPDYLVYQPFVAYWALFILAGTIVGIILQRKKSLQQKSL